MNKILNWTIGSFFRTIGRTIAFIVMGALIYYLLSYNGIGIDDLFFTKVDALALDGYINDELRIYDNERAVLVNNSNPVDDVNFQYTPNTGDNKYAVFPIRGLYYNERYTNNLSAIEDTIGFLHIYLKTNKNWLACETQNNFIVCPVPTNANMLGLYFQFGLPTTWSGFEPTYEFYLYATVNMYKLNETQLIEAINEQSEQQQQQHEEIMDSNTTEAEDEATSFFEDFDVPDVGGLSAIITAPLNTIRSLLNSSCTNLTLPLPYVNKNIVLPCMNSIYTEHFGAFFSIYQTIILAIIAYRCIRSIYFDIHGFTNPNDDRIEVMDL